LLAISPKEPPPRPDDLLSLPKSLDCRDDPEEEDLSLSKELEEYRLSSPDLDPKKSEDEDRLP